MKTRNSHTAHSAVPTVPAFLALPTEIRYEIYKLVLTIPLLRLQETRIREREAAAASLRLSSQTTLEAEAKPKNLANLIEPFTHLLRVCHQIYDEAFPFFYHHVTVSVAKPLAFANEFLLRLGSTKVSQLKSIEFDIGPLASMYYSAVESLNSLKFNQILKIFESYPELRNLDMVRMKVVGSNRMPPFSEYDLAAYGTETEAPPEQMLSNTTDPGHIWNSENTKALSRVTLKLVNGNLKGFRIFRQVANATAERYPWEVGSPLEVVRIYSITLRKVGHTT
jgi:hypothetical protein